MKTKIVLAGGTGFVGKYFAVEFQKLGYEVIVISRQAGDVQWGDNDAITKALEGAVLLINLAGKSVDCRYNEQNKAAILSSRIETTKALGEAILRCDNPPATWINSSTATIYRHSEDKAMTESDGEIGTGFSVNIATQWEYAFFSFNLPKTRQVALRMAIVLGKDGGVMGPFKNLVRFGLGGKQGNGRQKFSWIHIQDLFDIVLFINNHTEITGAINCAAPNPVDNSELMTILRDAMHIGFGLPTPKWLLMIGAFLIRTETELILKSRWVIPERLLNAGYRFVYPDIKSAIKSLMTD